MRDFRKDDETEYKPGYKPDRCMDRGIDGKESRHAGSRFCRTLLGALSVIAAGIMLLLASPAKTEAAELTANDGIYIENINVSGMNAEQINQVIADKLAALGQSEIDMYVNGTPVAVLAGELGLTYTNTNLTDTVLNLGQQGNIVQRYQMERQMAAGNGCIFDLDLAISSEAAANIVNERCVPLNQEAVNPSLTYDGSGGFNVTESKDGFSVNVESSVARLVTFASQEWHGGVGSVNLIVDTIPAEADTYNYSLVKDILGTGTTYYSDSAVARNNNIEVGTSRLNGILMMPGEELSVGDTMGPYDAEDGYLPAASYEMGSVVETYGGGICQVSTTLYRAVLEAELEVTERSCHSMTVGYVEPSMDAAVSEGSKDFKFVNNTDAPIFIVGYASGGTINFTIYGHETRDPARSIDFVSETLTTEEPGSAFTLDEGSAIGTIALNAEQTAHTGSTARAWKIIYYNGVEQSREQINFSDYQMTPNYYNVGVAGATDAERASLAAAAETKDLNTMNATISSIMAARGTPVTLGTDTAAAADTSAAAEAEEEE